MIAKLEYLLFISSNYGVHFRLIAAEFLLSVDRLECLNSLPGLAG